MNITQMHTGIDVGVNQLNSHKYRKIPNKTKDLLLNKAILEATLKVIHPMAGNLLNPSTDDRTPMDVNTIAPLIYASLLSSIINPSPFTGSALFELPSYAVDTVTSGLIHHNRRYYVIDKGSLDFADITPLEVTNGNIYTTVLPVYDSIGTNTIQLYKEFTYQITNIGSYLWSNLGISDVYVGLIFKPAADIVINAATDVSVQLMSAYPTLDTSDISWYGVKLYVVDNYNILEHRMLRLLVKSFSFSKGTLASGSTYIITTAGTDDLSIFGCINKVGNMFVSSKLRKINFTKGTVIARVSTVIAQIVNHSNESSLDKLSNMSNSRNPIAVINNNYISVLTSNRFDVLRAELTYIKYPNTVNGDYNLSCNLPPSIHSNIVDNVISSIMATTSPSRYQAVKKEEETEQKTHRI